MPTLIEQIANYLFEYFENFNNKNQMVDIISI